MHFNAITFYRIGRAARERGVPLVPRLCETLIFLLFNCRIPCAAEIGRGSRCGHRGIAVVLNANVRIGNNCLIRPGVVIGGRGGGVKGAAQIGDNVDIGVGAKVLGPVTIGNHAVIGANAVVLDDVPPHGLAVGVPAKIMRGPEAS